MASSSAAAASSAHAETTVKLFYQDQYMTEFDAIIVQVFEDADKRPCVVLNQTAFYPTSGGQLNDTGILGDDIRVIDVNEGASNKHVIIHTLAAPLPAQYTVGSSIHGKIDWPRRLELMQQHHGQHILSSTFIKVCNAQTLSFHMGEVGSFIDLDIKGPISDSVIEEVQRVANEAVRKNLPVDIRIVSLEEAKTMQFRKALSAKIDGDVRVVSIPDVDVQTCCGTHPSSTSQVESILILNQETIKKTTRVHFLCGARVLRYATQATKAMRSMSSRLACPFEPEAIDRFLEKRLSENEEVRKQLSEADKQLLKYLATELMESATVLDNGVRIIVRVLEGRDLAALKLVALKLTAGDSVLSALLSPSGNGSNFMLAGSGNLRSIDLRPMLKEELIPIFGGKGGGQERYLQGSFEHGSAEDISKACTAAFTRLASGL